MAADPEETPPVPVPVPDAESKPESKPEPEPRRSERERRDDPPLPFVTRDELDVGWGDEPGERDEAWYRRERPPHHDR